MNDAQTLHFQKLIKMYSTAPVNTFYEPILTIEHGKATLGFTVQPKHYHAAGTAHGSVYFKALDDAAFFAAQSLVEDVFVYTVSFTLYITRAVQEGAITARAETVSVSKNLILAEAVIYNANEKPIARGNGSFMRSGIVLNEEIGYCF
jgi:uncharacterized protein (TIGR00369 family)